MAFVSNRNRTVGVLLELGFDRVFFPAAVIVCLLLASWIAAQMGLGAVQVPHVR